MKPLKTRNSGTWTEARFRNFIISMIRRTSSRWGPRNEAKRDARHIEKLRNSKGRLVFHSVCNKCKNIVPETESTVDHIEPVIDPAKGFESWDRYIERMFCEKDGFQVLCKMCHDNKTKQERVIATNRKRTEQS